MSQAPQRSPDGSPANIIGSPFIELQSVDSTNNYARQQIHTACLPDRQASPSGSQGLAQHGMAIFAHEQVAGKGQRGRDWASEKGKNIVLSLLIKPHPLMLDQQFQLSACTAVSVHAFFMKYAIEKVKIKWPNDIYWQDRKAGGILIESVVRSRESGVQSSESEPDSTRVAQNIQKSGTGSNWEWAIVGIGININQTSFPENLPNPVSLKQITGNDHDPVELAKELCALMQHYFTELTTTGFDNIFRLYNQHLYKLNEKVKLKKANQVFEAMIKGVSPSGKLIARHSFDEEFDFGEVEWKV